MASAPDRPLRLLLLFSLIMAVECAGCRVDQCARQYLELEGLERPDVVDATAMCEGLREYRACLQDTARSCRGDLKYHGSMVVLNRKIAEFNCTQAMRVHPTFPGVAQTPSLLSSPPTLVVTSPPPPSHECSFRGQRVFRHCGLFGDPHLKTFFGVFQTCRVQGAWPLIDNAFLAVQVTNEPVTPDSLATATTKVTVVIRRRGSPCAHEKTYQASSEGPLPATFIDGTRRSGPDDAIVLTSHDPRHVEIYVRYIEATLVIRQSGRYLAFSARMPDEIARSSGADQPGTGLSLCARGCPLKEQLDPVRQRGDAVPRDEALARCAAHNLTDHYLDWCVFDVMTAGADDEFSAAAHHAQADVFRLDPASLKNRTTPSVEIMDNKATVARTMLVVLILGVILARL